MHKQKPGDVKIRIPKSRQKEIFNILIEFFNKHQMYDGESICQSDDAIIDSPDLVGDLADLLFKDTEIDYE